MNYSDPGGIREEMEALKQAAIEKTGITDFGEPSYEGPLAAWVKDLKNPDIIDFGRQFLQRLARKDLERRLKVLAFIKDNPEILDVEIPPIVFITGSPRTGTTLLHHLVATHPLCRPLLRWELMAPLPPPRAETYDSDPRIEKLQASIEPLRGSLLEQMHWVNADEPEENAWGFINCTGLLGCGVRPLMSSWSRWLTDNDLKPTYEDFRKLVKVLIWKNPPPEGGRLALKCVMTTLHVQSFADVFPEARFIIIHRDPFRALTSSCTAGEAICSPFIGDAPGPMQNEGAQGRETFNLQKMTLKALIEISKNEQSRVKNVLYSELMGDAVETVRSLYEFCNMAVPDDVEHRVLDYLEAQRKGKRAAPPKKLDSFGYDSDDVWRDPIVSEYCRYFGVEREKARLTDTRTGSAGGTD